MSGFGIHEQHAAGTEIAALGKRWREDAFLHQLSLNGSLMLHQNHDELWRECLQRELGQPAGTTWERMSVLLRTHMPAHEARGRLWHASYQWWLNSTRHRLDTLAAGMRNGAYPELRARPELRSLADRLELRGAQLTALSWVLQDTDAGTIRVVTDGPAARAPGAVPRRIRA